MSFLLFGILSFFCSKSTLSPDANSSFIGAVNLTPTAIDKIFLRSSMIGSPTPVSSASNLRQARWVHAVSRLTEVSGMRLSSKMVVTLLLLLVPVVLPIVSSQNYMTVTNTVTTVIQTTQRNVIGTTTITANSVSTILIARLTEPPSWYKMRFSIANKSWIERSWICHDLLSANRNEVTDCLILAPRLAARRLSYDV